MRTCDTWRYRSGDTWTGMGEEVRRTNMTAVTPARTAASYGR